MGFHILSIRIAVAVIVLCASAQSSSWNDNSDDVIAVEACGPNKPAVLTEPGVSFGPLMNENGTYELNQTCHWLIHAPTGSVVRLEFPLIEMEWTFPCAYAHLTVYDSDVTEADHYLEHFCGNATAPPMYSSHEDMLVVFWAGNKGQGRGFVANYTFIQMQDSACSSGGFEMTEWAYGGFTTPGWPAPYPASAKCTWKINSLNSVRLEFVNLTLEELDDQRGCIHDNVTVYDIDKPSDNVIGVYCGDLLPDSVGATGNSLVVIFQSNDHRQYSGMRTRFELRNTTHLACNHPSRPAEIDWGPGMITSPQTEISNCHWRLHTSVTNLIKLRIHTFDLPDCDCAGLDVYDGDTHNSPKIGRFCGNGWEEDELVFSENFAYLEYDSCRINTYDGFRIEYQFYDTTEHACGSSRPLELTQSKGLITSPNYGKADYPNNSNCQWVIMSSFGYVIRIDVLEFSLEYCHGCRCDFLRTYNGDSPQNSPVMEVWCGQERPLPVSTTQSDAYLTFVSDAAKTDTGFMVQYVFEHLATLACQAELIGPAEMNYEPGTILTPGYELGYEYPANAHCEWSISSSDVDKTIALQVKDLDLEPSESCGSDRLTVYDGLDTSADVIAWFCGSNVKTTVRSTGNAMYLKFESNEKEQGRGFHLEYFFEEDNGDSGLRVLPAILISLSVFLIVVLLCTFCSCSAKIKRVRDRILGRRRHSRTPRQNSNEAPRPLATRGHNVVLSDATDNDDGRPMPASLQVDRPPCDVDNQLYFAIANYPPPTYEEAIGESSQLESSYQTNQSRDRASLANSQSHTSLQNVQLEDSSVPMTPMETGTCSRQNGQSNMPRQNRESVCFDGSRQSLQYPLTRASSGIHAVPPENSPTQGNPDIGVGILMQTGISAPRPSRQTSQSTQSQDSSRRLSVSSQHNTLSHSAPIPVRSSSHSVISLSPDGQRDTVSDQSRDKSRDQPCDASRDHSRDEIKPDGADIIVTAVAKDDVEGTAATSFKNKPGEGTANAAYVTDSPTAQRGGDNTADGCKQTHAMPVSSLESTMRRLNSSTADTSV